MSLGLPPSNVSANPGMSPTPTHRENETSAWTNVNKAMLNIVKDTSALPLTFAEVLPRYQAGYLGGFGYRASANQPVLDHTLENIRVSLTSDIPIDEAWAGPYGELLDQLPPELKARLLAELGKPFIERNADLVVLNNVLVLSARVLSGLNKASHPPSAESLEATRAAVNLLLPFSALNGSVAIGNEIGQIAYEFLEEKGANLRDFDSYNNTLGQLAKALGDLNKVQAGLGDRTLSDELSSESKSQASKASEILATASKELAQSQQTNDLAILHPILNALSTVAASLSLPVTASAALYIGLSQAMVGIETKDSSLGMIGPALGTVINSLTQGISSSSKGTDKASADFLNKLTTLTLASGVALASIAAAIPETVHEANAFFLTPLAFGFIANLTPALATTPSETWLSLMAAFSGIALFTLLDDSTSPSIAPHSQADIEGIHLFAFSTLMRILSSSKLLETFFKEALTLSRGDTATQNTAAPLLAEITHLLMILSATLDKRQSPASLIEEQESGLLKAITAAQTLANSSSKNSDISSLAAITINQCQAALEEKKYNEFLELFDTLLEQLHTSRSQLLTDLSTLADIAKNIAGSSNKNNDDQLLTGVMNVV